MVPVTKLPFFAIENVLQTMEIHELFFLSFTSKRARNIIRNVLKWKNKSFCVDTVNMTDRVRLGIQVKETFRTIIMWTFTKPPVKIAQTPRISMKMENGMELRCRLGFDAVTGVPTIFCNRTARKDLPNQMYTHICALFGSPTDLSLAFSGENTVDLPKTGTVQHLTIRYGRNICPNVLKEFFQSFRVTDSIFIQPHCQHIPNFLWKLKNLGLTKSYVAPVGTVLNSFDGENGVFMCSSLGNSGAIEILKCWMEGKMSNLESLIFKIGTLVTHFSKEVILRDFKFKQWDSKRRQAVFNYNEKMKTYLTSCDFTVNFDLSAESDIERESDGMLATVVVNPTEFMFFAWKGTDKK